MPPSISQLNEEKDHLRYKLKENNLEYFLHTFFRGWFLKIVMPICVYAIVYFKRYEVLALLFIPFLVYLFKRQSIKKQLLKLSLEIEEMKKN